MRTLTIGVLIFAGGTLAALPFRRVPNGHDKAIGPSGSLGAAESLLVTGDAGDRPIGAFDESRLPTSPRPPRNDTPRRSPRGHGFAPHDQAGGEGASRRRPLTYRDLAIPLAPSDALESRRAVRFPAVGDAADPDAANRDEADSPLAPRQFTASGVLDRGQPPAATDRFRMRPMRAEHESDDDAPEITSTGESVLTGREPGPTTPEMTESNAQSPPVVDANGASAAPRRSSGNEIVQTASTPGRKSKPVPNRGAGHAAAPQADTQRECPAADCSRTRHWIRQPD